MSLSHSLVYLILFIMHFVYISMCVPHVCVCPWKSEESLWCPGAGVIGGCEPYEDQTHPLEEQQILLMVRHLPIHSILFKNSTITYEVRLIIASLEIHVRTFSTQKVRLENCRFKDPLGYLGWSFPSKQTKFKPYDKTQHGVVSTKPTTN